MRALPSHAYLPGRNARPEPASSGDSPPWDQYVWGVELYNHGYFWEAHEAWEALWRSAQADDAARRAFLKGLIQCSAACLKAVLGDAEACRRLASRGLAQLAAVPGAADGCYLGLQVARFVAAFRGFAASQPLDVTRRPLLEIQRADGA